MLGYSTRHKRSQLALQRRCDRFGYSGQQSELRHINALAIKHALLVGLLKNQTFGTLHKSPDYRNLQLERLGKNLIRIMRATSRVCCGDNNWHILDARIFAYSLNERSPSITGIDNAVELATLRMLSSPPNHFRRIRRCNHGAQAIRSGPRSIRLVLDHKDCLCSGVHFPSP